MIPHLVWLYFWGWAFFAVLVFNWFATLFAGRSEEDVQSFSGRWCDTPFTSTRTFCWPRIRGPASPASRAVPIDLELDPPEPQPRLDHSFRIVLVIPAYVFAAVLGTVAQVIAFVGWFVCLALGRMPKGMRDLIAYCLRYQAQTYAYLFLLTSRYPTSQAAAASSSRRLPMSDTISSTGGGG